jgi:hypothetical protein
MLAVAKCRLMAILRSELQPDCCPAGLFRSVHSRRQLFANAVIFCWAVAPERSVPWVC